MASSYGAKRGSTYCKDEWNLVLAEVVIDSTVERCKTLCDNKPGCAGIAFGTRDTGGLPETHSLHHCALCRSTTTDHWRGWDFYERWQAASANDGFCRDQTEEGAHIVPCEQRTELIARRHAKMALMVASQSIGRSYHGWESRTVGYSTRIKRMVLRMAVHTILFNAYQHQEIGKMSGRLEQWTVVKLY